MKETNVNLHVYMTRSMLVFQSSQYVVALGVFSNVKDWRLFPTAIYIPYINLSKIKRLAYRVWWIMLKTCYAPMLTIALIMLLRIVYYACIMPAIIIFTGLEKPSQHRHLPRWHGRWLRYHCTTRARVSGHCSRCDTGRPVCKWIPGEYVAVYIPEVESQATCSSILDRLKTPTKSDLARKRKIERLLQQHVEWRY